MLVEQFRQSIAPLRKHNYSFLWLGQTISLFGDQFYSLAFIWLLTTLTRSSVVVSTVMTVSYLPQLVLLLVGGLWADFVNLRHLVLWSDLLRLFVAFVFALLVALGYVSLPLLLVVTIVYSVVGAFFMPALSALFISSIATEEMSASNALFQISRQCAVLLGPALAGYVIAQWNVGIALIFDAISYAFSASLVVLMRPGKESTVSPDKKKAAPNTMRELTAGLRFLWSEQGMLAIVLLFAITNAFNDVEAILVPLLARFSLHLSAERYGLMSSCFGVGSLLGALIMSLRGNHIRRHGLVICGSMVVFGITIITMGLALTAWQLYIAYFFFGFSFMIADLASSTLWLRMVPAELRGRVFSVLSVMAMGLNPLGLLLAGFLGATLGVRAGIWIGGGAVAFLSTLAFFLPAVRNLSEKSSTSEGN